jgi:hypothetical protein
LLACPKLKIEKIDNLLSRRNGQVYPKLHPDFSARDQSGVFCLDASPNLVGLAKAEKTRTHTRTLFYQRGVFVFQQSAFRVRLSRAPRRLVVIAFPLHQQSWTSGLPCGLPRIGVGAERRHDDVAAGQPQ